jgi:hypothetical protein
MQLCKNIPVAKAGENFHCMAENGKEWIYQWDLDIKMPTEAEQIELIRGFVEDPQELALTPEQQEFADLKIQLEAARQESAQLNLAIIEIWEMLA